MIKPIFLVLILCQAACAQFPDVDAAEAGRAGPRPVAPDLMPFDALLDEDRFTPPQAQSSGDALLARAAALRRRAAALRQASTGG